MNCIVSIGYQDYLIKKDADAAKLIALLASAVRVKSVVYAGRIVYFLSDQQPDISMKAILPSNLFTSDPTVPKCCGPLQLHPAKP